MTKPQDLQTAVTTIPNQNNDTKTILQQTSNINFSLASKQASSSIAATTEVVKQVDSSVKDISYQILAEPIRVVSPESIINTFIAGVNTLGQAIINPVKELLGRASDLSQNPKAIDSNEIKDCIDKANKKCTSIADTQANSAELSNGHIITAGFNKQIIVGNSVDIASDTATNLSSPYTGISSQDVTVTGNNSITQVSDLHLGKYKQSVQSVDGTAFSQSQTSLKVSTESNDDISKVNRYVGTEEISNVGKINKVIADTELLAASGGTTQIASYDSIGMQSNGDVSITAAKSNNNSRSDASSSKRSIPNTNGGNIYLISTPSNNTTNMMVMSNSGVLNSTTGNLSNTARGSNIVKGGRSAVVTSDNFAYLGTPLGGMFVKGGRSFLGKLSFPTLNVPLPNVVNIPALPALPSLPTQELENCIPKKFKNKNTFPDFDPNQESVLTKGTTGDDAFTLIPPIPTSSNRVQLPKESQQFPNYDPNSEKVFGARLPAPSVSSIPEGKDNNLAILSPFTPLSVFVDKYSNKSQYSINDLITSNEVFTFSNVAGLLSDETSLNEIANSLLLPQDILTTSLITQYLTSVVPDKLLQELIYPQFYLDLLNISLDKLDTFSVTVEDFISSDRNIVESILNIIKEYPQLRQQVINLIKEVTTIPAIGFLSRVTSFVGGISNFSSIPKIIQSGDFNDIYTLVKPILNVSLKGTIFSSLLNNTDLLDIGQSIVSGGVDNVVKSKIDKVINDTIQTTIEANASSLLGDYNFLFPSLKDIFNKVKIGEPIIAEDYINEISSILTNVVGPSNINLATNIYKNIEGLLKDISSGDIFSVITGSSLENLINTVFGNNNSGSVSKVFSIIKDAVGTYKAVELLPKLLELMNEYNIPTINQVSIALNCLDLFNKIKGLVASISNLSNNNEGGSITGSGVDSISNNKATISLLENIGRITQAANTINSVDNDTLNSWEESISIDVGEEVDLEQVKISLQTNLTLDTCFRLPRLNTFQSDVEITEVTNNYISFKLSNIDLIKDNFYLLPKLNDLVQIRVQGFYSLDTREYLNLYQTDYQYTPSVYNFIITQYNLEINTGIAYYDNSYSSLVLENPEGVLYKIDAKMIGITLNPDIVDSYLLA